MTRRRACIVCSNPDVEAFVKDRVRKGLSVRSISNELTDRERKAGMGYKTAPSPTTLDTHMRSHVTKTAPVSTTMPSFETPEEMPTHPNGDVASTIQRKSLEALERGEMRLTASHALRAQEMLDRRAEKQRDRELMLVLARVLTKESVPPSRYVGMAEGEPVLIEGEAVEVEAVS